MVIRPSEIKNKTSTSRTQLSAHIGQKETIGLTVIDRTLRCYSWVEVVLGSTGRGLKLTPANNPELPPALNIQRTAKKSPALPKPTHQNCKFSYRRIKDCPEKAEPLHKPFSSLPGSRLERLARNKILIITELVKASLRYPLKEP